MLKDITIGQFFPGTSIVHKLDPRVKILLALLFIVVLFIISNIFSLFFFGVFILVIYKISLIPFKLIVKNIKPILPLVLFTSIFNIFFSDGEILFQWWKISVYSKGIFITIMVTIRIIEMMIVSSLLTYTTSPIALTDALEKLMLPLKKFRVPVNEIAMMMTISLRFVPTLIQETDKIMAAQKSRGARIDSGNIVQKAKSFIPIIIPLFVSAFKAADDLAIAMECRCYNGGIGRTKMNNLKFKKIDIVAIVVFFIYLIAIILLDRFII